MVPRMDALTRFKQFAGEQSQADLARRLGCHRSIITHIKSGRRRPSFQLAVVLEAATAALDGGPIRPRDWLPPMARVPRERKRKPKRRDCQAPPPPAQGCNQ